MAKGNSFRFENGKARIHVRQRNASENAHRGK
jgi:hypothetical protein